MPARSRTLEFKVVDHVNDTEAIEITEADIGRIYYLRICFDRGTVYNRKSSLYCQISRACGREFF